MTTISKFDRIAFAATCFEEALSWKDPMSKDDTGFFFDKSLLTLNEGYAIEAKEDWDNTLHIGDCTKIACSCLACGWGETVELGNMVVYILRSVHPKPTRDRLISYFEEKWDDDSGTVCMEMVDGLIEYLKEKELY
mgnify:CR=1 FL=1